MNGITSRFWEVSQIEENIIFGPHLLFLNVFQRNIKWKMEKAIINFSELFELLLQNNF